MQTVIHYALHFLFPILIAYAFFRKEWKKAYFILILTMLVDLDHLVADPIFQDNRCSIGFHPLHTGYAIIVYFVMIFLRKPFNIIGIGLLFHMVTDFIDCLIMFDKCKGCFKDAPAYDLLNQVANFLGF